MAEYSIIGLGQFAGGQPELVIIAGLQPWPLFEIRTTASDFPSITEIGVGTGISSSGSLAAFGFGTPAAAGVNPVGTYTAPVAHDPNAPTSSVTVATGWTTPPTSPTKFFRRASQSSGAGGVATPYLVFRFPKGIQMTGSSTLVLYQIAVTANRLYMTDFWVTFNQ